MPIWIALALGVVEGLTEFLPISSTGHLVLAEHWLSNGDEKGIASFEIVIQLGAVLAVLIYYRKLLAERAAGLVAGKKDAQRLLVAVLLAFLPVAVVGLLFRKAIKAHLFFPLPIAIALIVGGIVMILVDRWARTKPRVEGLDQVTPMRALVIGLGQCFALIPGTSRSMSTIAAAQLTGLSTATAAEFSFLVALPALGAATVFEAIKARHELVQGVGIPALVVGLVTSFVVAWAALAGFLSYLKRRGLEPFGYYRIALGIVVILLVK